MARTKVPRKGRKESKSTKKNKKKTSARRKRPQSAVQNVSNSNQNNNKEEKNNDKPSETTTNDVNEVNVGNREVQDPANKTVNEDEPGKQRNDNVSETNVGNEESPNPTEKNRNDDEPTETFVRMRSLFKYVLKQKFDIFEKYGASEHVEGKWYFNDGCRQSTYEPQVLRFDEHFQASPKLIEFANILHKDISIDYPHYKEIDNNDITVVPLAALVTQHDSHQVFLHSKLELPQCDQIKDVRKHVYEVCFINNIWEVQSVSIRKTVLQFFSQIFTTEVNHITSLLRTDQTFVLMIINRSLTSSTLIEVEQIIAAVIFSADQIESICIDYLSAGLSYYSYGYGTLILHMAQVFAAEYNLNHQKKGTSDTSDTQITYLTCTKKTHGYYLALGFKEMSLADFFKNEAVAYVGKRINIIEWSNDPIDERLKIMYINGRIPRQINLVSVCHDFDIEHSLYDNSILEEFNTIKPSKEVRDSLKNIYAPFIERIKLRPDTEDDLKTLQSSTDLKDFVKIKYNEYMKIPVGKLFGSAFKDQIDQFDNLNFKQSQTMLIALENLEIQFIPQEYNDTGIDDTEQWVSIQCSLCNKKVFIKKTKDCNFVDFFMKMVYSVWYQHVFCYSTDSNNPFDSMNTDWNVCNNRKGEYLQRLRDSTRFDISVLSLEKDGENKLFIWKKYLEFFFTGLKVRYSTILDSFVFYISKVKDLLDATNSTVREKRTRKSLITNYTEERIIGAVPTSKNKNNSTTNRSNSKYQKDNKMKRHDAESTWNETFYNDLEEQLTIDKIEYVNVEETDELYVESIEYLEEREKLKDKNYINHWGEVQHENHFLGHLLDGTRVVLEDEWFKQYDYNDDFSHYTLSKTTYKNALRRCNRPVSLNRNDKSRITKHVQSAKGMCEIQSIKKYKRDANEAERFEHIEFLEDIEVDGGNSEPKKVKHTSVSRYDYIGVDATGRSHFLSNDWVELNFKDKHKRLYNDICGLKGNKLIKIPEGSSNLDQNIDDIEQKDFGPKTKYRQESDPSCLFTSLANALDFLGHPKLGHKLVQVYYSKFHNQKDSYVTMNDVLKVTKDNAFHSRNEEKFKFVITKVKKPNAVDLLPPAPIEIDIIYHCILSNHHSIAISNGFIFDPVLPNSLMFNEINLRKCAQVCTHELTSQIILRAYKYTQKN